MKNHKKLTIKYRTFLILLTFLLLILTLSFISLFQYKNAADYLLSKIDSTSGNELIQIKQTFEFEINEIENVAKQISQNTYISELVDIYENDNSLTSDKLKAKGEIISFASQGIEFNSGIKDIIFFTKSGNISLREEDYFYYRLNNSHILDNDFFSSLAAKSHEIVVFDKYIPDENNLTANDEIFGRLFSELTIMVKNDNYTLFIITYRNTFLEKIFSEYDESVIIFDKNSSVIWDNISLEIPDDFYNTIIHTSEGGTIDIENESYRVFVSTSAINDYTISYLKNVKELLKPIKKVFSYSLIYGISSIFLLLMFSSIMSKKLTFPINMLVGKAQKFKSQEEQYELIEAKKKKRKVTYREKLMYYFIISVFLPILLYSIIFHFSAYNIIHGTVMESVNQTFEQTNQNIENFVSQKEKIARKIAYDLKFQDIIYNYYINPYVNLSEDQKSYLFSIIDNNILLSKQYFRLQIFSNDGTMFYGYPNNENFDRALEVDKSYDSGEAIWLNTKKDKYNRDIIQMYIAIKKINEQNQLKTLGYLECEIDELSMEQVYKYQGSKNAEIFIQDENGLIISHADKTKIGKPSGIDPQNLLENETILYKKVAGTPWYQICIYDKNLLFGANSELIYSSIYILIIILMILILASYVISFYISNIINKMNKLLKNINLKKGEEFIHNESIHITEIEELYSSFNEMAVRIEKLISEVLLAEISQKQLEAEKTDLELKSLQAQINPHFLCNTLETIRCLLDVDSAQKAAKMLDLLNNLFKYGISNEEKLITIEQELTYVKSYASIMNIRFDNKINFIWDIDEKLNKAVTIKLVLQPIIENSISHGIGYHEQSGTITVKCFIENENTVFRITDDGCGMDENTLDELIKTINGEGAKESIGLYNVNRRIKRYFGATYGISIKSQKGQGTQVDVIFPYTII